MPDDPELPDRLLLTETKPINVIIESVSHRLETSPAKLNDGNHNQKRNIVMYVCRQQGYTLSQISKAIGLNHYSAVNSAIRRMNDDDISLAHSIASDVTRDKICPPITTSYFSVLYDILSPVSMRILRKLLGLQRHHVTSDWPSTKSQTCNERSFSGRIEPQT
jgi:hypothetical protein